MIVLTDTCYSPSQRSYDADEGNINLSWMNQSPLSYTLSQGSEDDRRPTINKKKGNPA
jgi:hypothetical protein